MNQLAILLAASITGGHVGPFVGFPSRFPQILDAGHTPGGDGWYQRVESVLVPSAWVITCNGVVTNTTPPTVIEPDSTHSDWRIQANPADEFEAIDGDTQIRKWRPGSFDLAWTATGYVLGEYGQWLDFEQRSYYARATNLEERVLENPIYCARSVRSLGKYAPAALTIPFEAYFERLYYASKSGQTAFDTDKWGPRSPATNFPFNLPPITNFGYNIIIDAYLDFVPGGSTGRHVRATGRMLHDNTVNLLRLKQRLDAMMTDSSATYNNPGFIYRPGWILDGWGNLGGFTDTLDPYKGMADENAGNFNWWATTDTQLNPAGSIMPQFEWQPNPLDRELSPVAKLWMSNCVTLAMFPSSDHFAMGGRNPLVGTVQSVNFGNLNVASAFADQIFELPLEYMLPKAFPHSASMELDDDEFESMRANARMAYEKTRKNRLNMRHFCGVNQILACMDRTIHRPRLEHTHWRDRVEWSSVATYSSSVRASYDMGSHELELSANVNDLTWETVTRTNYVSRSYAGEDTDIIRLLVSDNQTEADGGGEGYSSIDAYVDEDDIINAAGSLGLRGTDFDIRLADVKTGSTDHLYTLCFRDENDPGNECEVDVSIYYPIEVDVPLLYSGTRSYHYESTVSNAVRIGQVHEAAESDGRADACHYGIMAGIMTAEYDESYYEQYYMSGTNAYDAANHHPQYKSFTGSYSTKSDLVQTTLDACRAVKLKIDSALFPNANRSYTNPGAMVGYVDPPNRNTNLSVAQPTVRFEMHPHTNVIANAVWHVTEDDVITPHDGSCSLPLRVGTVDARVEVLIDSSPEDPYDRPACMGFGKLGEILATDWKWEKLRKGTTP